VKDFIVFLNSESWIPERGASTLPDRMRAYIGSDASVLNRYLQQLVFRWQSE